MLAALQGVATLTSALGKAHLCLAGHFGSGLLDSFLLRQDLFAGDSRFHQKRLTILQTCCS